MHVTECSVTIKVLNDLYFSCELLLIAIGTISRKTSSGPSLCSKGNDIESPYYRPLQKCIGGTQSQRWIPIEERTKWPSRARLSPMELKVHGKGHSLLEHMKSLKKEKRKRREMATGISDLSLYFLFIYWLTSS